MYFRIRCNNNLMYNINSGKRLIVVQWKLNTRETSSYRTPGSLALLLVNIFNETCWVIECFSKREEKIGTREGGAEKGRKIGKGSVQCVYRYST